MKEPSVLKQVRNRFRAREVARRENSRRANDALNRSKRAIFALHRGDKKASQILINEASALFATCEKRFRKFPELEQEGVYRAALEEYAEAILFMEYVQTGTIQGKLDKRAMHPSVFLGGLCDTTGEIVRDAVRQATDGSYESISHAYELVEMVVVFLLDLDLTGPLRNKDDQAKRNLRHLEQMMYEVSLRK